MISNIKSTEKIRTFVIEVALYCVSHNSDDIALPSYMTQTGTQRSTNWGTKFVHLSKGISGSKQK